MAALQALHERVEPGKMLWEEECGSGEIIPAWSANRMFSGF
jgi:hypothetical protein